MTENSDTKMKKILIQMFNVGYDLAENFKAYLTEY